MSSISPVTITHLSNSVTHSKSSVPHTIEAASTSATSAANLADKTTISQAARDRVAEETKGIDTYDFTNMTPNDMLSTINSLIKSGQMSLDESSSLVHFLIPGSTVPTNNSNSINSDSVDQPVNFYSKLGQMIAFNKYIHNESAVVYGQKALVALDRFQGTKIME